MALKQAVSLKGTFNFPMNLLLPVQAILIKDLIPTLGAIAKKVSDTNLAD